MCAHMQAHTQTDTDTNQCRVILLLLLLTYLMIRVSFIPQIFIECRLYARRSSRHWGHSKEKRSNVLPPWTYILTAMWYPGFLL